MRAEGKRKKKRKERDEVSAVKRVPPVGAREREADTSTRRARVRGGQRHASRAGVRSEGVPGCAAGLASWAASGQNGPASSLSFSFSKFKSNTNFNSKISELNQLKIIPNKLRKIQIKYL